MKTLRTFTICLFTSSALIVTPALAQDSETAALKEQLRVLTERLNQLEKKQAEAAASTKTVTSSQEEVVTAGDMPNSWKLPGTNTSFKFGGYVKADAVWNDNGYDGPFLNLTNIPLEGSAADNQDGRFFGNIRHSRINLSSSTPTDIGKVKTFWEVDFYGTNYGNPIVEGSEVRVRHAYGEVGKLLVGLTWTNFMDLDVYPESLDLVGPAGVVMNRRTQLRYTDTYGEHVTYALALENPTNQFTETASSAGDINLSQFPDATARVNYKDTWGVVGARALVREMSATNASGLQEDSEFGWGLGVHGKLNIGDKDSFSFGGQGGEGIGNYMFDVAISGNGNTFNGTDLNAQMAYGGYADYRHYWNDDWRSNFLLGYVGIDNEAALAGAAVTKELMSGHVNLIWSPVSQYRVGLEYMHGERELENGQEGDINRVMMSFMYLL
jgi:hypothetical protein